ncbi:MAG: DUF488 domain-containing protein [Caldilineaceae bacterium]|nr:DUF488 domain-containing protein [Caldilineaceae bacterium]MBP8107166.1 DUF488 domain-containing protein [Caldilineaceae bacterium]MBP8121510.1 DUF488 domain-containing protein [Caldilineaceae bacterium]MBP9073846.1 DUF488 domain-containing protein [Caldilineaceae bacterium]
MIAKLVTIGVYGWGADDFFRALHAAGVDTFCDVRWRRGVRGSEYAFANSQRLQDRLAEMGIRYLHRRDLAPSPEVRAAQHAVDKAEKVAKRQRVGLSEPFVERYTAKVLADFDPTDLLAELGEAQVIALCCVERDPAACHRSLLAARLSAITGTNVEHLLP